MISLQVSVPVGEQKLPLKLFLLISSATKLQPRTLWSLKSFEGLSWEEDFEIFKS